MSAQSIVKLPLLHDHHSHVSLYASFEGLPDIGGLDEDSALALLRALPADRLSLVKGWRSDRLALAAPTLESLPPLILVNASLHGYVFSPAALPHVSGLWPELARHASDPAWGERNLPRLFAFYGRLAGLNQEKLASFMDRMEALGLGSLEDMTLPGEEALALVSASPFSGRIVSWTSPDIYRALSPASRAACRGVKLFLDGSLGARSAALDAPFSGGEEGSLLFGDEELLALLSEPAALGAGLSAHALGHGAIAQILRCLEALSREGLCFPSVRLEHLQFIDEAQARRCRNRGIILSMQPKFNSDSRDYADRLIPRHRAQNDPFRMLIDQVGFVPGVDLVFGSDGMPHGPEYALQWSLFPDYPGQALSLEEFEAGYGPALSREGEGPSFAIDWAARSVRAISPR
jgi:predicted amidohydrolase YtcJ